MSVLCCLMGFAGVGYRGDDKAVHVAGSILVLVLSYVPCVTNSLLTLNQFELQ